MIHEMLFIGIREADFVIPVVVIDDVLQDCVGLPYDKVITLVVHQHRYFSIGVERHECRSFLFSRAEVDLDITKRYGQRDDRTESVGPHSKVKPSSSNTKQI